MVVVAKMVNRNTIFNFVKNQKRLNSFTDTSPCILDSLKFLGDSQFYHLRNFDNEDYNGVYEPQFRRYDTGEEEDRDNWILINNRPVYQKIVPILDSNLDPLEDAIFGSDEDQLEGDIFGEDEDPFDDKCIWWDTSRHWLLGLCENLGTKRA